VFEPLCEQADDVVVVEGVEDQLSGAALANEPRVAQEAELVGDGGLGDAEEVGDVADTELGAGEGVEDADASGVTEDLECVGEGVDKLAIEEVVGRDLNI